jgi:L-malate glycosyltransferase
MKVLYVDHTALVSGAQRSLLELLVGGPPDVAPVLATPPGPLADLARANGVRVVDMPGTDISFRVRSFREPLLVLGYLAMGSIRLRVLAHRLGMDLIHANSPRAGILALLARLLGGPPVVVHVRDALPEGRLADAIRWVIGQADGVVAISEYTAEALRAPAERVEVVFNAVDFERFNPESVDPGSARRTLGVTAEARVLAVIAQITPWKGQDDAIRAFAGVRRSHPSAVLLIAGEAKFVHPSTRYDNRAYERSLHALVAQLDLEEAVMFLGEREDVPQLLAAVDLLLVPSWEEPFGRTVIEAAAMGVPVVATSVGGTSEIIDEGRTGLLLAPRQPQRWAEVITRLLSDPARLRAMGETARQAATQRFSRARHVEAMLDLYRRVSV